MISRAVLFFLCFIFMDAINGFVRICNCIAVALVLLLLLTYRHFVCHVTSLRNEHGEGCARRLAVFRVCDRQSFVSRCLFWLGR